MDKIKTIIVLCLAVTTLAACGPTYTPEQLAQLQQQRMKMFQQYRAQLQQSQQAQNLKQDSKPTVSKQEPLVTEKDIAQSIQAIPPLPKNTGVLFKRNEDGFTANGEHFTDYEGEISTYAFDGLTGNVTYLAEVDDLNYVIKFVRASINAEPITLATATKSRGTWKVRTTTGKNLSGYRLFMTSKGFVLLRKSTGFFYEPGKGITSFSAPRGFRIAEYQTGDLASTQYILVEKIPAKSGSLSDMWAATKALGGVLGGDGNQDYALYNIKTKKVVPLYISYTGDEPIYKNAGQGVRTKNSGHYYWRVEWFTVPSGTYVVYVVNGIKSAKVIHLDTGLEKVIFERMLGISSVNSYIQKNGKIKVVADMGFSTESVDDLEAFMLKDNEK